MTTTSQPTTPSPVVVDLLQAAENVGHARQLLSAATTREDAARQAENDARVAHEQAHRSSIIAVTTAAAFTDWHDARLATERATTTYQQLRKAGDQLLYAQGDVDACQRNLHAALVVQQGLVERLESLLEQAAAPTPQRAVVDLELEPDPEPTPADEPDRAAGVYVNSAAAPEPGPELESTPAARPGAQTPAAPPVDPDQAIGAQVLAELATAPAKAPQLPDYKAPKSLGITVLAVINEANGPLSVAAVMKRLNCPDPHPIADSLSYLCREGKIQRLERGIYAKRTYKMELRDKDPPDLAERGGSAERRVLEVLQRASEPVSVGRVAKRTGLDPERARQVLGILCRDGKIARVERGVYARLQPALVG